MNTEQLQERESSQKTNLLRVPVVVMSDICGSPELVKLFDGHRTLGEIVKNSSYFQSEIEDFVYSNIQQKKMVWKDEWSPLFWCGPCNLPLLNRKCDCCHTVSSNQIDLKFPCNPRPVLPHDEHMFKAVGFPWPMDYSMILNAYKYPDHWGWELIYGGKNIGDIIQTHENSRFQFIPSPQFDRTAIGSNTATMNDLIKANTTRLNDFEKEAVAYMNSFKEPFKISMPILGFSGGKDSIVLAHIASLTKFKKILVYQIDTGIEPEYNAHFADEFLKSKKKFIIKKHVGQDIFWKAIKKMGPHALDFQWCRTILKNWSIYREKQDFITKIVLFLGRVAKARVLIVHGARNREEPERVALPRTVALNGAHPTVPGAPATAILPLAWGTDLDVWMYIHARNLPVNPAYTKDKNQRLLCMFCFEKNDYEFETDIKAYPEVYARLESELKVWQKKFNFPDEWITKRLWRYNESNSTYMHKLNIVPRVGNVVQELEKAITFGTEVALPHSSAKVRGKIHIEFKLSDLAQWFKAFGKCSLKNDVLTISPNYANIVSQLGGSRFDRLSLAVHSNGVIDIETSNPDLLPKITKLVYGWALIKVHCISCGGCVKEAIGDIDVDKGEMVVVNKLKLKTIENILKSCPMHPDGMRNMLKPLNKEFSPTSCTSCHIRYNKDMNFVNPVDPDTPK